MNTAENLQPFQRVLSWSLFTGAKDNSPDRHNGMWDLLAKTLTTVVKPPKRKDPADAKKAVPAFSGTAFFEGTTRSCENAEMVHLLVFDFDNCIEVPIPGECHPSGRPKTHKIPIESPAAPEAVIEKLQALGYAAVVYTTWSSSPQLVKFRVVIPLQAPVSPAYWTEASEWSMEHLGFQGFRDSKAIDIPVLRDTARLNFLPCALDPSSVRVWELKGKHLNIPTAALPTYEVKAQPAPTWQSPRAKTNPRTGRDWWRDYKIDFKTLNLVGLVRSMGIEVGKSQPWNGGYKWRCHCPWASEHTHGLDDDCAVIIRTEGDWPSFKCQHSSHALLGLREICETAGAQMVESYGSRYTPPGAVAPVDEEEAGEPQAPAEGNDAQRPVLDRLHRNQTTRAPLKVPANLAKILRFDPQWGTRLSLNEMSQDICHDLEPKRDHFVDAVQEWIQDNYHLNFGRDEIRAKLLAQSSQNPIHPVREHFFRLPKWDGVERLNKVADQILHAAAYDLNNQYITRWFIGAVRRVMHPGCKMDTTLVLAGPQGYLKSTFFQVLAGEWFNDSPIDMNNKDGYLVLHRAFITELGEIDHLASVQSQEKIKAFTSSRQDIFRAPYAASATLFPRSCILVGTTNQDGFLTDTSGSRRFWPIKVTAPIEIPLLTKWRDQLWAEAIDLEMAGVDHWLEAAMDAMREIQADDFAAEDPWEHMAAEAAVAYARTGNHSLSDGIPVSELMDFMGIPKAQQTKGSSMKLAGILKKMKWEKVRRLPGGGCSTGGSGMKVWRPKQ